MAKDLLQEQWSSSSKAASKIQERLERNSFRAGIKNPPQDHHYVQSRDWKVYLTEVNGQYMISNNTIDWEMIPEDAKTALRGNLTSIEDFNTPDTGAPEPTIDTTGELDFGISSKSDAAGIRMEDIRVGTGRGQPDVEYSTVIGEEDYDRYLVALEGGFEISFSDDGGVLHAGHIFVPDNRKVQEGAHTLLEILERAGSMFGYRKVSGEMTLGKPNGRILRSYGIDDEDIMDEEGKYYFEIDVV